MFRTRVPLLILTFILVPGSGAQNSQFPDLSHFTKSGTENLIIVADHTFSVRSVVGVISFANHPGEPLPNVLFEILGPGSLERIRHATSDQNGKFRMGHVPQGTYRFKATRTGFSSVVGRVEVSRKADKAAGILIDMPVGN